MRGGMEAIYADVGSWAAQGAMFSARQRLRLEGGPALPAPVRDEVA